MNAETNLSVGPEHISVGTEGIGTGGAGGGGSSEVYIHFTIRPDSVIRFLEHCGDADIEAGIGALLGNSTEEKIRAFKQGLTKAISDSIDRKETT